MILVRGPWDETPGSPDLPFDVNHSMFFPSILRVLILCTRVSLLWYVRAGKNRRGKLVHWVERASFEKIQRLLDISKKERNHEVILTVKNLHDLSHHPSPYIVPIIPHPLPLEIVEGEHFITVDLLNLISGSSSPAREAKSEVASQELVINTKPVQPSSASEDSDPCPPGI